MSRKTWVLVAFLLLMLSVQANAQYVVQNPTASQNIVQPPSTVFSSNNVAGIVYTVGSYNWSQPSSAVLTGGQPAQVPLSPCPAGIWVPSGANAFTRVWLVGTGGSPKEAVVVTATTCPLQGGGSGTVTITPQYSYPNGSTLGSASQGLQEAINAANLTDSYLPSPQLGNVIIPPGEYVAQARVSILGSKQYINASGAVLTCNMADTCLFVGDYTNQNFTADVTVDGLAFRAGYAGKYAAIEDNAQHTTLRSIPTRCSNSTCSTTSAPSFASIIQVDNDQSAVIEKLNPSPGQANNWSHCGTDWCSVAVYGPGASGDSGVIWIKDSILGWQCAFNGVDNQDGNTLRVSDSIAQANPQFSIRAKGSYNNPAAILDNVYMDVGNCPNQSGVGIAGLISEGYFSVVHGMQPAGALPVFGNGTSGNIYEYYIVAHSSALGTSAPYLAGYAYTSPLVLPIPVKWPQVGSGATYDLLRQTVPNLGAAAPYGTACSVATGLQQQTYCSNGVCSYNDTGSVSCNYPVTAPSTYAPALTFWPGAVVLTEPSDSATNNAAEPRLYTDIVKPQAGGYVNSYGANVPTVFAHQCSGLGVWSSIWMSCPAGDSVSSDNAAVGALVLQYGTVVSSANGGGLKGRLNFMMSPNTVPNNPNNQNTSPATHLITLGDSNAAKTLATPGHRPTNDANDTWIGLDNTDATVNNFQLAFGAPVSISSYIGNTGDNTSWLERLQITPQTGPLKSFQVPVTTNAQIRSTLPTNSGLSPFTVQSAVPVSTLTVSNHPTMQYCGNLATCSATAETNGQVVFGTISFPSGSTTVTLTGINPPFTTIYTRVANDTTNPGRGVNAVPITGSSVLFTGVTNSGGDTVSYQCVGK